MPSPTRCSNLELLRSSRCFWDPQKNRQTKTPGKPPKHQLSDLNHLRKTILPVSSAYGFSLQACIFLKSHTCFCYILEDTRMSCLRISSTMSQIAQKLCRRFPGSCLHFVAVIKMVSPTLANPLSCEKSAILTCLGQMNQSLMSFSLPE